jgi:tetratricopeptide (TPR) repeat protein
MSTAYLCSFHIPKTGGTTFAHHVQSSLAPDEFFLHGPFARAERFMRDQPQLEETSAAETDAIRVVHGHGAGLEVAASLQGRFPEYLVILRDPFQRFVSGFNHFNGERRNNAQEPVSAQDYLETRGTNFYSKLLFQYFRPLAGPGKGQTMERILPILQSFKYFVVTEHINDQVPVLCELLQLPPQSVETRRVNSNKVDALVDKGAFDAVNQLDNAIYRQLLARGPSLANPFGYNPQVLRDYLQRAWQEASAGQRLRATYKDLVLSLEKSFKLHAAHEKLASQPNPHVKDVALLTQLVSDRVQQWLGGLDPAALSMAYFWTGVMYMNAQSDTSAEKYFRESIKLNPKNDNSLARLAQLLFARKVFPEAQELIGRAMALRPDRQTNQKIQAIISRRSR